VVRKSNAGRQPVVTVGKLAGQLRDQRIAGGRICLRLLKNLKVLTDAEVQGKFFGHLELILTVETVIGICEWECGVAAGLGEEGIGAQGKVRGVGESISSIKISGEEIRDAGAVIVEAEIQSVTARNVSHLIAQLPLKFLVVAA